MNRKSIVVVALLLCIATPAWATQRPPKLANPATQIYQGATLVLEALTIVAEKNQRLDKPLEGEELTCELVRTAANAAEKLPEDVKVKAFLLAVGIGLDDSDAISRIPFFGTSYKLRIESFEPATLRARRIKVLGQPTMRNRRDLCQHFAVSITLCEFQGKELAEVTGRAKENLDMLKDSGFSFSDLQADIAGIEFAERIRRGEVKLADVAKHFTPSDYLPSHQGLKDGLGQQQFQESFGLRKDEKPEESRLHKQIEAIRKTVKAQYD